MRIIHRISTLGSVCFYAIHLRKMSAVISSAKRVYRQVLIYQGSFLASISIVLSLIQWQIALAFGVGSLAAFLPFCLFVFWVFFRTKSVQTSHTVKAFYWGEALKWGATIIWIILIFTMLPELNHLFFFVGYFVGLLGNMVLPIWLNRIATT